MALKIGRVLPKPVTWALLVISGLLSLHPTVYLFELDTGFLLHTFLNPFPDNSDLFGSSITAVGSNILIGAHNDDSGGNNVGAAYLFDGSTFDLLHIFQAEPVTPPVSVPEPSTLALVATGLAGLAFFGPEVALDTSFETMNRYKAHFVNSNDGLAGSSLRATARPGGRWRGEPASPVVSRLAMVSLSLPSGPAHSDWGRTRTQEMISALDRYEDRLVIQ